jgi:hypothetical protein
MSIYFVYTKPNGCRETIAATYSEADCAYPKKEAEIRAASLRLKGQASRVVEHTEATNA